MGFPKRISDLPNAGSLKNSDIFVLVNENDVTSQTTLGTIAGMISGSTFTGNTLATCIEELWVHSISGCSPVTIGTSINSPTCVVESGGPGTGIHSISYGDRNIVSGDFATAFGTTTSATTKGAHAEGSGTWAKGDASHAEGGSTIAEGSSSHAEGRKTTATGDYSHAEGDSTKAIGSSTHAEGNKTTATGDYSHAEGDSTKAIGDYSHAEGYNTSCSGKSAHAEGYFTEAHGENSHAEGRKTLANGEAAHAEGNYTTAKGVYSHAEGHYTISGGDMSHAGGDYSIASGHTSFIHSTNSLVTGDRSVILGGENITGSTDDTVYMPNVNLCEFGGTLYCNSFSGCSPINIKSPLIVNSGIVISDEEGIDTPTITIPTYICTNCNDDTDSFLTTQNLSGVVGYTVQFLEYGDTCWNITKQPILTVSNSWPTEAGGCDECGGEPPSTTYKLSGCDGLTEFFTDTDLNDYVGSYINAETLPPNSETCFYVTEEEGESTHGVLEPKAIYTEEEGCDCCGPNPKWKYSECDDEADQVVWENTDLNPPFGIYAPPSCVRMSTDDGETWKCYTFMFCAPEEDPTEGITNFEVLEDSECCEGESCIPAPPAGASFSFQPGEEEGIVEVYYTSNTELSGVNIQFRPGFTVISATGEGGEAGDAGFMVQSTSEIPLEEGSEITTSKVGMWSFAGDTLGTNEESTLLCSLSISEDNGSVLIDNPISTIRYTTTTNNIGWEGTVNDYAPDSILNVLDVVEIWSQAMINYFGVKEVSSQYEVEGEPYDNFLVAGPETGGLELLVGTVNCYLGAAEPPCSSEEPFISNYVSSVDIGDGSVEPWPIV